MGKRPKWWLTFLAKVWPITGISARATQWPVVGKVLTAMVIPLFSGKNFNISYLPVNEELKGVSSAYLPEKVLEELIRRSSHRVTIKRCHCRDAKQCKDYPIEDSCLLMGEGTKEIDPWIGTPLTVEAAISHMRRMVGLGLTPMIGRIWMDNLFYGVRDRGKLLTVCFCCHCCCTVMSSAKYFPKQAMDSIVRLRGMTISVDEGKCRTCSTYECLAGCIVRAYTRENGRVVHDPDRCKGCGWCVAICPHKAVTAAVEDIGAAADEVIGRIGKMIHYQK
jgi:UDP-glucose 4-epimerase